MLVGMCRLTENTIGPLSSPRLRLRRATPKWATRGRSAEPKSPRRVIGSVVDGGELPLALRSGSSARRLSFVWLMSGTG